MVQKFAQQFMIAALVLLGVPMVSNAQDIFLASGGAGQTWKGTQPKAAAGLWLDQGAVGSGDARRDLIVGSPGGPGIAGAVYIIFGGLSRTGDLVLSSADTVITSAEAGNGFGHSTTAGHILSLESSGGSSNLVIGAPGASGNRGAVYPLHGRLPVGRSRAHPG